MTKIAVGALVRIARRTPQAAWIEPGTHGVVVEVADAEITGMEETLYIVQIGNLKVAYEVDELILEEVA